LTVETLLLRNGYPETAQDSHSNVCIRTSIFDTNENGLSMRSEVRLGTDRRRTGVSKLAIDDPQQPGRWTLTAKRPSTLSESFILALTLGFYCSPMFVRKSEKGFTLKLTACIKNIELRAYFLNLF
jgi:hypothetical protein